MKEKDSVLGSRLPQKANNPPEDPLTVSVLEHEKNNYQKLFTPVGVALIAVSIVLMVLSVPLSFSLTALILGFDLVALDRYLQHRMNMRRIEVQEAMMRLRNDKNIQMRQKSLLERLMEQGLPEDITWSEFKSLLDKTDMEETLLSIEGEQGKS